MAVTEIQPEVKIMSVAIPATSPIYGQVMVSTAGTAVPLAASSTPLTEGYVEITGHPSNTGLMAVGDSAVDMDNGHILSPDKTTIWRTDDLSKVYLDTDTSGHKVSFVAY